MIFDLPWAEKKIISDLCAIPTGGTIQIDFKDIFLYYIQYKKGRLAKVVEIETMEFLSFTLSCKRAE